MPTIGTPSTEISEKYEIANNSFVQVAKEDVKDKIEIEIGDTKQIDFYPQAKFQRWDNEINLSLRLVHDEATPLVTTESDRIIWQGEKIDARFYNIESEEHPEGAYEFDILLKERPKSNIVEFTIQTKGLDFFYQPELTQEEINEGCERPENVIGSYAVYYKDCPANHVGGKEYKAGKAFHIYRPLITDADGKEIWGELNVDTDTGILSITIDERFLDEAFYPVVVDPTFGYTTKGSSNVGSKFIGTKFSATENGTVTSITRFLKNNWGSTVYSNVGYFNDSSGAVGTHVAHGTSTGYGSGQNDWATIDVSGSITNGSAYWLISETDGSSHFLHYYDSGESNQGCTQNSLTYDTWSDNPSFYSYGNYKDSIYATYTASGGDATINASAIAEAFTIPSHTISTVYNLNITPSGLSLVLTVPSATILVGSPSFTFYNTAKKFFLDGTIDIDTDNIKALLVTNVYTFNKNQVYLNEITNEVTGAGYTTGGVLLTGNTVEVDTALDLAKFTANNPAWLGSSFTFKSIILYKSTGTAGTSPLICYIDAGSDNTASGQTVTIAWNSKVYSII
jgi:hypothetical protein